MPSLPGQSIRPWNRACGISIAPSAALAAIRPKCGTAAATRAIKRNEELLSVLSEEERAVLDRALDVLTAHAQKTLAKSRETAGRVR
jgi:hypothetical protein